MLIPFLWLYVFKCDVYTQLLINQIKKIFECFICFWKCFYAFVCLEFLVQNVYFRFLLKKKKNSFRGRVHRISNFRMRIANFRIHWILDREFCDCFASKIYPQNLLCASVAFSWVTSREAYPWKARFCSF